MKNLKRSTILLALIISISLITSCNKVSSDNQQKNTLIISYEDYSKLFDDFESNFKIESFDKVVSSKDTTAIIAVDKDFSFGKRGYLTYTKEQDNTSTQKRIEYLNKEKDQMLTIDVTYLSKPLENDMVFSDNFFQANEGNFMRGKYTEDILSYKNILILSKVFSKNEDKDLVKKEMNITREIAKYFSGTKF